MIGDLSSDEHDREHNARERGNVSEEVVPEHDGHVSFVQNCLRLDPRSDMAETLECAAAGDQADGPLGSGGINLGQNPAVAPQGSGQLVGYVRVSSTGQDVARQVSELKGAGCARIFEDHGVSGVKMQRPGLDQALEYVRAGDTLVVQELSRLGRDVTGVLNLVHDLQTRGVSLRILGLGLDTASPTGRLILTVIAAVAEMERAMLQERVLSGLAEARRQGRTGGRPPALTTDQRELAVQLHSDGRTPFAIGELLGCSERTVRRAVTAAKVATSPVADDM